MLTFTIFAELPAGGKQIDINPGAKGGGPPVADRGVLAAPGLLAGQILQYNL
jgi:hypothetical protein